MTIPHGSLTSIPHGSLTTTTATVPHHSLASVPRRSLLFDRIHRIGRISCGATAPNFGNCRGCATRIQRRVCRRTEASFMRRQPCRAVCGRSPADWEGRSAAWENRESRRSKVEGREGRASSRPQWPGRSRALPSKNFPTRRRRFPIWCAVAQPQDPGAGA